MLLGRERERERVTGEGLDTGVLRDRASTLSLSSSILFLFSSILWRRHSSYVSFDSTIFRVFLLSFGVVISSEPKLKKKKKKGKKWSEITTVGFPNALLGNCDLNERQAESTDSLKNCYFEFKFKGISGFSHFNLLWHVFYYIIYNSCHACLLRPNINDSAVSKQSWNAETIQICLYGSNYLGSHNYLVELWIDLS